jgi:hypothetical protein
MSIKGSVIADVLTTPSEIEGDREFFSLAFRLENGQTYLVGTHLPIGFSLLTNADPSKWNSDPRFGTIIGKSIENIFALYGDSEPFVVFTDETTLRLTDQDYGTLVEISSLTEIERDSPWILENWHSILGKIREA